MSDRSLAGTAGNDHPLVVGVVLDRLMAFDEVSELTMPSEAEAVQRLCTARQDQNLSDDRVWIARSVTVNPGGCWLFSAPNYSPRGSRCHRPNDGRKHTSVRRLAWSVFRGPLHSSTRVYGACDNKRCINPWHTHLGIVASHPDPLCDLGQTVGLMTSRYVCRESGCWIWTGSLHESGQPTFSWHGRAHKAHRLLYSLIVAPLGEQTVLAKRPGCSALCVNPYHHAAVLRRQGCGRSVDVEIPETMAEWARVAEGFVTVRGVSTPSHLADAFARSVAWAREALARAAGLSMPAPMGVIAR